MIYGENRFDFQIAGERKRILQAFLSCIWSVESL